MGNFAQNTQNQKTQQTKIEFKDVEKTHWADPFYDELKKFQLPLKGYEDLKSAKAITKGEVAKIIAARMDLI